jgi:sRNA-binding regulator protein Hfq
MAGKLKPPGTQGKTSLEYTIHKAAYAVVLRDGTTIEGKVGKSSKYEILWIGEDDEALGIMKHAIDYFKLRTKQDTEGAGQ